MLSMIGYAQNKLSKWLNELLQPVLEEFSEYTIKDSFTFAETMRELERNRML